MNYGFSRGAQQYQQVSAFSSAAETDPHKIVQLLMDGALDRIAQAKGAMQRGEVAAKGVLIGKSVDIVAGLQACLDHSAGGEIATNLDGLYDYMQRRLLHANLHNDAQALDEVAGLLREIRSAWAEMPRPEQQAAGAATSLGAGTTG